MRAVFNPSMDDVGRIILGARDIGLMLSFFYSLWILFFEFLPALFLWSLSLFRRPQAETPAVGLIDEVGNPPTPRGHSVTPVLKLCVHKSMRFLFVTGLMQAMFYLVAMNWMFVSMSLDTSTIQTTSTSDIFETPTYTTTCSGPSYATPTPAPVGKRTSMMRTAMPTPMPTALGSTGPSSMPNPMSAPALTPNPFVRIFTLDKPFPAWVMMQYFDLPIYTGFAIALLIHLMLRFSAPVFSILARAFTIWIVSYLIAAAVMLTTSRYDVDSSLSLVMVILAFVTCVSILHPIASWLEDLGTLAKDTTEEAADQQAQRESRLSSAERIVKDIFCPSEDLAYGVQSAIRFLRDGCWRTAESLFFAVAEILRDKFIAIDLSLHYLNECLAYIEPKVKEVKEQGKAILKNTKDIESVSERKADKTHIDEVVGRLNSLFETVDGFVSYTYEDAEAFETVQLTVHELGDTVNDLQTTKASTAGLQAAQQTVKDLDGVVNGLQTSKADVTVLETAQQTLEDLNGKLGKLETTKAKVSDLEETVETVIGLTGRIKELESTKTEFMGWKKEMDDTSDEVTSIKDSKADCKALDNTNRDLEQLSQKVDRIKSDKGDALVLATAEERILHLMNKISNLDSTKADISAVTFFQNFMVESIGSQGTTDGKIQKLGDEVDTLGTTKADTSALKTTIETLDELSDKIDELQSRPADATDLTGVTSRIDGLDTSVAAMGTRQDHLKDRIDGLDTSFNAMGSQHHLTKRVLSLETDRNKASKRLGDAESANMTLKADLAVARQDIDNFSKSASLSSDAIGTLRNQKASVKHFEAANGRIDANKVETDAKISQLQKDKTVMQAQIDALIKKVEALQPTASATEPETLQSIRDQVSSEVTQQISDLRSETTSQHKEVVKAHEQFQSEVKSRVIALNKNCQEMENEVKKRHESLQGTVVTQSQELQTVKIGLDEHKKHVDQQIQKASHKVDNQVNAINRQVEGLDGQTIREIVREVYNEFLCGPEFESAVNSAQSSTKIAQRKERWRAEIRAVTEEDILVSKVEAKIQDILVGKVEAKVQEIQAGNDRIPHNDPPQILNGGQPTHGEHEYHHNLDTIPKDSDHESNTVENNFGSGDGSLIDPPGVIIGEPATSPTGKSPNHLHTTAEDEDEELPDLVSATIVAVLTAL